MVEAMIEEEMGSRSPPETEEEYENRRWASEAKVLQNLQRADAEMEGKHLNAEKKALNSEALELG